MRGTEAADHARRACSILGDLAYRGIALAPALELFFYLGFMHDELSSPRPRSWRSRGREHPWPRIAMEVARALANPPLNVAPCDVLFAADGERYTDDHAPLARRFGARLLWVKKKNQTFAEPPNFGTVDSVSVALDFAGWLRSLLLSMPRFHRAARAVCDGLGLARGRDEHIVTQMIWASIAIEQLEALMDRTRPRVVLVSSDHHYVGPLACAIAKRREIPSVTFQHGILDRATLYLTVPLIADHYLAWGENDAALLRESGAPESAIHIVGAPRIQRAPRPSDETLAERRRELGVASDARIAILGTSSWDRAETSTLIETFAEAIAKSPGWVGFVRPHPAQGASFVEPFIPRGSSVRALETKALSFAETAALADAIVMHQTSLGIDVILHEGTVVGLDVLPASMGYVEELATVHRAAYRAKSAAELVRVFESIGARDAGWSAIREAAKRLPPYFYAHLGEAATDATFEVLERLMRAER